MKICIWKQTGIRGGTFIPDVDTSCGHHLNRQPTNALLYLDDSYVGKGNEYRFCMWCGGKIEVSKKDWEGRNNS